MYQQVACLLSIRKVRTAAGSRDQLTDGWEGIKPGWTRVDFNYFISDRVCDYIIDAVDLIASYGHQLLADYHFTPGTGRWRHHAGPAEPPFRLTDVRFGPAGPVGHLHRRLRAGEDVLDSHLLDARNLLTAG